MYGDVVVNGWARVREGCPITVDLVGDEAQVQFGAGRSRNVTELVLDVEVLRELVRLGERVLLSFDDTGADDAAEGSAGLRPDRPNGDLATKSVV